MNISTRLKTIASNVYPYKNVVDVGTDHCFVPIYLVLNNIIDSAIATDINIGPVNEAKKNIISYNLDKQIEARIGNGLNNLTNKDKLDVIIIAGMGGKLITDILDNGKNILNLNKRLILQPNVGEDFVRRWLCENHYEIVNEIIIKEDNIIYEIIISDKVNKIINLSEEEILFGPILLKNKNELFIEKWKNFFEYKKQIYNQIPDFHENKKIFLQEIKMIENILNEK